MRKPRQPVFALQPLESRTLFALNLHTAIPGGPPPGTFAHDDSPEVVAARDELRKDIVQMRADQRAGRELINADHQAVVDELAKAAVPDLEDQLEPLRQKLADDRRVGYREIRQDDAAIRAKMQEFAPTIRQDKKALRQAMESGDQDAIAAAKEKLSADRATVESAVQPLQDELMADQQKTTDLLASDRAAMDDKLSELDPALAPLLDKLEFDGKALDEKMAAARAEIQGDLETLRAAIQAAQANGETTTGLGGSDPVGPPPRTQGGETGMQPPPNGAQPPPTGEQQPPPGGEQQPPPPPPPPGGEQQPPPPPPPPPGGQQPPPSGGDRPHPPQLPSDPVS